MDSKSIIKTVKTWARELTEIGILLLALSVVLGLLLGDSVPFLSSANGVVDNITGLIETLSTKGVVGLIALGVILHLVTRKEKSA